MTDLDYSKLFELILDELIIKASEDISAFNCSDSNDEEEKVQLFRMIAEEKVGRTREITWKSPLHQDEELTISMNFAEGTMFVQMPGEEEGIEEVIGHGATNGSLKKKFMKLYRLVEFYVNVQLEEENMSNFFDSVQKTFPSIMDRFLLESDDDEEETDKGSKD